MRQGEDVARSEQTFRFARYGPIVGIALLSAIMPTIMVYDLVTVGIAVLHEMSPGRRHLPYWLLYGLGLLSFAVFLQIAILPALKYIWRGYVFRTRGDQIMLDGTWIDRSEILLVRETLFSGWAIHTSQAKFHIHPFVNPQGLKVFREIISA